MVNFTDIWYGARVTEPQLASILADCFFKLRGNLIWDNCFPDDTREMENEDYAFEAELEERCECPDDPITRDSCPFLACPKYTEETNILIREHFRPRLIDYITRILKNDHYEARDWVVELLMSEKNPLPIQIVCSHGFSCCVPKKIKASPAEYIIGLKGNADNYEIGFNSLEGDLSKWEIPSSYGSYGKEGKGHKELKDYTNAQLLKIAETFFNEHQLTPKRYAVHAECWCT